MKLCGSDLLCWSLEADFQDATEIFEKMSSRLRFLFFFSECNFHVGWYFQNTIAFTFTSLTTWNLSERFFNYKWVSRIFNKSWQFCDLNVKEQEIFEVWTVVLWITSSQIKLSYICTLFANAWQKIGWNWINADWESAFRSRSLYLTHNFSYLYVWLLK